jgi:hypothetical protein
MALTPDEARKTAGRGLLNKRQRALLKKLERGIDNELEATVLEGQQVINVTVGIGTENWKKLQQENVLEALKEMYTGYSVELFGPDRETENCYIILTDYINQKF